MVYLLKGKLSFSK